METFECLKHWKLFSILAEKLLMIDTMSKQKKVNSFNWMGTQFTKQSQKETESPSSTPANTCFTAICSSCRWYKNLFGNTPSSALQQSNHNIKKINLAGQHVRVKCKVLINLKDSKNLYISSCDWHIIFWHSWHFFFRVFSSKQWSQKISSWEVKAG